MSENTITTKPPKAIPFPTIDRDKLPDGFDEYWLEQECDRLFRNLTTKGGQELYDALSGADGSDAGYWAEKLAIALLGKNPEKTHDVTKELEKAVYGACEKIMAGYDYYDWGDVQARFGDDA